VFTNFVWFSVLRAWRPTDHRRWRRGEPARVGWLRAAGRLSGVNLALLVPFLAAVLLIQLVPGPGMLFIVANGITGGARAGVAAALGAAAGMVVHTVAAALGLAALFVHAPLAYDLVRIAGAGYLLWLAVRAFRSAGAGVPTQPGTPGAPAGTARVFVRALANNLANPKVILFFVSYLPQFVDRSRGHVTVQLLVLGALFLLVGLVVVDVPIGLCAGRAGRLLARRAGVARLLGKAAGTIYAGLAAWTLRRVATDAVVRAHARDRFRALRQTSAQARCANPSMTSARRS
jgi:threonine/homoserine/homoserine lactone efflux protein